MTPAAHDDASARPDEKSNLKNHSREDNDDDGIEVKQVFVSNAAHKTALIFVNEFTVSAHETTDKF